MVDPNNLPPPGRILVVEDDPDAARFVSAVLAKRGYDVTHTPSPNEALAHLGAVPFDLVLSDLRMPQLSGVEFAALASAVRPGVPFILMTAHATMDAAIDALRVGAYDFLTKPLRASALIEHVETALQRHALTQERRDTVVAIGAHPDDIEIGAAGTLLAHRRRGDRVIVATLTAGGSGGDVGERRAEATTAARLIGAELVMLDLEDTRIAEGNPTVAHLEALMNTCSPTIVYTHSDKDVHQDHRATHRATMIAARRVPRVYCYESPSSTVHFQPSRFVAIDEHLDRKLETIAIYRSQTAKAPYLAPDLLSATARYWGRHADGRYAEPFEVVRERMPVDSSQRADEVRHAA